MLRGRDGHGDRARAANLDATAHAGADRLGMALPGWGHPGPRAPLLTGQTTEVPRCSWPASAA
jgi:hypothetical protein